MVCWASLLNWRFRSLWLVAHCEAIKSKLISYKMHKINAAFSEGRSKHTSTCMYYTDNRYSSWTALIVHLSRYRTHTHTLNANPMHTHNCVVHAYFNRMGVLTVCVMLIIFWLPQKPICVCCYVCVFQSINYLVIQIWMLAEMHHTRSTCTDEANAASIVTRYDAMANAAFLASNVQPRASNAPHIYLYMIRITHRM